MEEQTISRLALNSFREGDEKTLLGISSEHVCLLTKVLKADSQDSLDSFLWPMKFEFQVETSKASIIAGIQMNFDPNESSDFFVHSSPIYLSPDPETNFCLLETRINIASDSTKNNALAVLLLKEGQYWKFHNILLIKSGYPFEYFSKLGWRENSDFGMNLSSIEKKEETSDQLSLDDYWGTENSDSEQEKDESEVASPGIKLETTILPKMTLGGASETEGSSSRVSTLASQMSNSNTNNSEVLSHVYGIIKGTYGMARTQGISKEMFESLVHKALQTE
ncbi:hypothetical protein DSO57_1032654 [Entomophthora muscae]|uniref:Uncharacterized protein n=1 Tax=Entomophthora muscae TaxID=34485 RepID=A0ACC2UMC4_9FUNG|nr:hypothetical protein DSO57_1032654 [Entomophthora muscae]